jgi:hypothetical protein
MEDTNKFLLIIIGVLSLLCSPLIIGLCISVMWAWFVAPLGVVKISLLHGAGLYLLFRAVAYRHIPSETPLEDTIFSCYLHTIIVVLILALATVVHWGM